MTKHVQSKEDAIVNEKMVSIVRELVNNISTMIQSHKQQYQVFKSAITRYWKVANSKTYSTPKMAQLLHRADAILERHNELIDILVTTSNTPITDPKKTIRELREAYTECTIMMTSMSDIVNDLNLEVATKMTDKVDEVIDEANRIN